MKKLVPLIALCLAFSFTACTKKEETAPAGNEPQAEGTTSSGEGAAENPPDEMQEKKDGAQ